VDVPTLDDSRRIDALRQSGLLRHDPSGRLDLLCEMAGRMLQVPIAQVNVLDGTTQYTVGKYPPSGRRSIEVANTGCQEVIRSADVVNIPDMLQHPVLCQIPIVGEGARAYLGVPIWHEGHVIGSFCVLANEVREWAHYDVAGLMGLAKLARLSVELE
jgi:phosphoserine phosphatase RsbU/P